MASACIKSSGTTASVNGIGLSVPALGETGNFAMPPWVHQCFFGMLLISSSIDAEQLQPMIDSAVNSTVLHHSDGHRILSVDDLESIKSLLVESLRAEADGRDFAALAVETASEACFIGQDGILHIGHWTLSVRDGELRASRNPVARSAVMMVPTARFEFADGSWKFLDVGIATVRGR